MIRLSKIRMFLFFALIDPSNEVKNVIVGNQAFIASQPGTWIQTDQQGKFTKNFAVIGSVYDAGRNAFIQKQPFPSWILNEKTYGYEAPKPRPVDGKWYEWDEASLSWLNPDDYKKSQDKKKADADDAQAKKDAATKKEKSDFDATKLKLKTGTASPEEAQKALGTLIDKLLPQ